MTIVNDHQPGHIRYVTRRPDRRIARLFCAVPDARTLCGALPTEWDMTYADAVRAHKMGFPVCDACAKKALV